MLHLYPKYLNRCKTNELSYNIHKKTILFFLYKTFIFNIQVIKKNVLKNIQRYTFRIFS